MYNTSASDLDRTAGDLNKLANTYTNNAQQLDQQVSSLDGTTSQVINGGPEKWQGQASTAFVGAWSERKARMQQAAQLLDESAQHLKQLAQIIDTQLPTIRSDQTSMKSSVHQALTPQDQQSIISSETQAQNAIAMALGTLNAQLEELAAGIKDCPQEKQQNNLGGNEPSNVNMAKGSGKGRGDGQGGSRGNRSDTANQQEKKDFNYAWSQIQRTLGKTLTQADRRRLHDEITKQGFDKQEIIDIGVSMFKDSDAEKE